MTPPTVLASLIALLVLFAAPTVAPEVLGRGASFISMIPKADALSRKRWVRTLRHLL
jgi:hypothetical protein